MGNAETLRGRLTPVVVVAVLLALAVIVALGVLARPAAAQDTFTQCSSCHNYSFNDAYHNVSAHKNAPSCGTCHVNGTTAAGLLPSGCATCHTPVSDVLAKPTHAGVACGTTPGCHGVPSPSPTATTTPTPTPTATATPVATTMTLKVAPTTQRLGRSVKVTGVAGTLPALAGAKVALKIERKVGTKWVKMKTATKTVNATSGAFSWSYKTVKKGAHRVTASIAKTSTFSAKKLTRTFKVR